MRKLIELLLVGMACMTFVACTGSTNATGLYTSPSVAPAPTATPVPKGPTSFVAGTITSSSASFTWTNNATTATSYQVERCTGSACSNFAVLSATLGATASSYTDATVAPSTSYLYRISAINSGGVSSYLTSSVITTPAAAPNVYTCSASSTTTNIDYGQQVGVAGTARGVWSDVKYIPSGVTTPGGLSSGNVISYSTNTGSAYVDSGSQALKYTYWNGSVFSTEVVYGDAATNVTYVRLAYLSNSPNTGIPIIFFSNGAVNSGQIMMAVRSTASLTTTGTWTVSVVDANAGIVNKALEVAVSPIDQVALTYQATTLPNTNNIRFVYCSTNCNSFTNYNAQASTGATARIDSGTVLAAQVQIGLGWCQASLNVYNPAVIYGASATTYQYATCLTGSNNLANCLSNANWTKTTATIAATGASGTNSALYLDPSLLSDVPKMMVKDVTGGGLRAYTTAAATGCGSVLATTAMSAAGTPLLVGSTVANTASSYFKLLKAPDYTTVANERFFAVMNDGTTNMKWAATTTNSFAGAWQANALGTIATATLNTAGAMSFGADLSMTTGQLITLFGTASSLFDATLGVVDNFTATGAATGNPGSANNIYYQLPVEDNGHMQLSATQVRNVAMASTSTNRIGVAWVDFSSGVATTGKLKYSLQTGTAASSPWEVQLVPSVGGVPGPQNPSIAYDQNDKPWIGYWDVTNVRFVLATNTMSDGSGIWTSYQYPVLAAGQGAPAPQPAANMVAVAMSYTSGVASPVMIVVDNGTALKVSASRLNPATGAWTTLATVDTLSAQGGSFLSADWSSTTNTIYVAYQSLTTGNVRVKYSYSSDGGVTWANTGAAVSVSAVAQGEGATIKLNPVTGNPSIAYYDRANNKLYYAPCTTGCTTATPTFTGTVTSVLNGVGIAGLSAAGNYNLLTAGLTFSALGNAYIAYNSGVLDIGAIRIFDNVGGTMPSAVPTTVVPGTNGNFLNAAATNGGIPWGHAMIRLNNGVLATAYNSPGSFLAVTSCGN